MRLSNRDRQPHHPCTLLAGDCEIREFKGRFHFDVVSSFAGIRFVHTAAADVWLLVSDSDAAGDGEISPGSFLAIVDAATDFSRLGEHARLVHHWNRRSRFVFMRGIIFVPTGKCASHRMDAQTTIATGDSAAVLSGGPSDHAVRHTTRRVSLRYGVFTAHQRRQRK